MPDGFDTTAARSEVYAPLPETLAHVNLPDYLDVREQAAADPVAFWDAQARQLVDWYAPYSQVVDASDKPFYKWFTGGKTNIVHNALDRHVRTGARTSWR